ncbi:MAG TPA: N,N-dimethylformamidase beta subunit family domain-containing protein [Pseudomonadales bacterium]|nr:N,N-dimethylformamidase beta subunit family domain-containing protein [Pseudomonadales bacterium]
MPARFVKEIVGYANPLSVRAGDALDICISCDRPGEYDATLVRLISGDARPHGTGFREIAVDASFRGRYNAERQALLPGSYAVLPDLPATDALTVAFYLYPTLLESRDQTVIRGGNVRIAVNASGLVVAIGDSRVEVAAVLLERHWYRIAVAIGASIEARIDGVPSASSERPMKSRTTHRLPGRPSIPRGDWELAREAPGAGQYNGRIEALRIYGAAIDPAVASADVEAPRPARPEMLGAWDFAIGIETSAITDVSGHGRHGTLHQTPTRAVRGAHWRGDVFDWRRDPSQYAAIHFHDDDLTDAGWRPSIRWIVPGDLPSGVYAVKLTFGESEDYVTFFVGPSPGRHAAVALLASTATYLAYANQHLGFSNGVYVPREPRFANEAYLAAHPEVGRSLYDHHRDGSGVHFSSRLRPVLNLKPKGMPWSFVADTNLLAWLHRIGQPFDVITDEVLHRDGAAVLADYRVVITGTHPEYHSTAMLDGIVEWLDHGGRLMYMGGNGFYWRIAYCPDNPAIIEVRRAEDGTRAWIAEPGEYYHAFTGEYGGLWRRVGRPPNALVGIGFAAQGFDGGTHYRLTPDASNPRVAFVMNGIDASEIIGAHGTQGGGAAGEEIDRYDAVLGSPPHAVVIASSENHKPGMLRVKEELFMMRPPANDPEIRADLTFFETPSGGAVFSTGSISYAGSLSTNDYDNDIARLTGNVLRRFIDPTPFDLPDGGSG